MSSDLDALRAIIREVIRDVLPSALSGGSPGGSPGSLPAGLAGGAPVTETVNLSTDGDLAAFVDRLLGLGPEERDELRSGRKRFRLAAAAPPIPAGETGRPRPAAAVRRVERGAVTERVVRAAAAAGERLVLGPGAVLTPLARDKARASGVQIEKER